MSQQGLRQASVRAVTGTTSTYEGDWMALFDLAGIGRADFNCRLLAWINLKLTANYTELNGAMQALAAANGAFNFSSMGTFDAAISHALALNFGAKTLKGYGGYPAAEAAASALSGTGASDFVVNALGDVAPAGTVRSGVAGFSRSSYLLTGASGRAYSITVPTNNDMSIASDATDEINNMFYGPIGVAGDAPRLGANLNVRNGSWNAAATLGYTAFRSLASYSGTGRITVQSEAVDAALDSNGNPRLHHGAVLCRMYWDPDLDEVFPVDFKNLWWNWSSLSAIGAGAGLFRYAQGQGVSHYNSRFEVNLANADAVQVRAINLRGGTADGCYFYNCGEAIADQGGAADPVTPTRISNNIFQGNLSDTIKVAGGNAKVITRNFAFGWGLSPGEHQDYIQANPGNVSGLMSLGEVSENICVQDLGGIVNAFLFAGDVVAPTYVTDAVIRNNLGHLGNVYGIGLNRPDGVIAQFNTMMCDPYRSGTVQSVDIALGYPTAGVGGINGATVTHNLSNTLQINVTGSVTQDHNINSSNYPALAVNAANLAPYIAAVQTMFPNMPTSQGDASWRTRAGSLRNWTPANLAFVSGVGGGVVWPDGKVSGYLFPATSGNTIGAKNDGSVFSPNDPTWVAAHPPAS